MATSPSASSRRRASRTLLRLAPVAATMSASTSRCPGTSRPRRMRSRTQLRASAELATGLAGRARAFRPVRRTGFFDERRGMAAGMIHDPAPGAPPENLEALARAGFAAVSLAGNHVADCGAEGVADTIDALDRLGIAHAGAGLTLAAARAPALIERRGRRIALLSYNCVG